MISCLKIIIIVSTIKSITTEANIGAQVIAVRFSAKWRRYTFIVNYTT